MEGCDAEPDGSPGELTVRRFERFGAGGAKLIWGEACAVVPRPGPIPRQLVINEAKVAAFERLVQVARSAHRRGQRPRRRPARRASAHPFRALFLQQPILAQHDPLLDSRTVVNKSTGATAGRDIPLISDDELDRLQDRYVEAACLAARAGFDFVDVKQCHRYLLNELLAARSPRASTAARSRTGRGSSARWWPGSARSPRGSCWPRD